MRLEMGDKASYHQAEKDISDSGDGPDWLECSRPNLECKPRQDP